MNPTQKQIEAAADAMRKTWDKFREHGVGGGDAYFDLARAAYPHLATWEEPTDLELSLVYDEIRSIMKANDLVAINDLIRRFVRRRNAALLPVDPRREKILAAIRTREFPMDLESEIEMTNKILAALKEE